MPMRRSLALVAIVTGVASGQVAPELLKEDLKILRNALDEGHPGAYRYASRTEIDAAFARAAAKVTRPMTGIEFYRVVAPAIAAVKCGHTGVRVNAMETAPVLPVEVRVLDGRVYVFRDYTESGKLTGAELRSINGTEVRKTLATMLVAIHGDGDSRTAGLWRLSHGRGFARQLHLLAGIESSFRVQYVLGGKADETTVEGMPIATVREVEGAKFPQDRRPAFSAAYKVVDGGAVGLVKVYQFGGKAEDGTPLNDFFHKAYTDLSAKKVGHLIIDVRDNSGGADELGKLLFSYLVDQPFPYYHDLVVNKLTFDFAPYLREKRPLFDDVKSLDLGDDKKYHYHGHPNWGIQQPLQPHFSGKVYALMNGGSFSTTGEFLSTLHHHRRATFIGEESAAGYYGNTSGDSASLVLPNSKLEVPLPLVGYYMAIDGKAHGRRGIEPDVKVTYSIADYLAGRDLEMDTALRLIHGGAAK